MKRLPLIPLLLLTAIASAEAQTYIYVDLGTNPYSDTFVADAFSDQQVGYGTVLNPFGPVQPLIWNNSAASATALSATGYSQAKVNGLYSTWAVGSGVTAGNQTVGLLWAGLTGEPTNMNPSFAASSVINAAWVNGATELVGSAHLAGSGQQVAVRWTGASPVYATNLNPSGATSSQGLAASLSSMAGSAVFSGVTHAYCWLAGASAADLQPTGALGSEALGVSATFAGVGTLFTAEAGDYTTSSGAVHACLWSSTASSLIDLHPASGYTMTVANDLTVTSTSLRIASFAAGYGTKTNGVTVPLLWANATTTPTDLSSYMPAGTTSARAVRLDATLNAFNPSIVGNATVNGSNHAFVLVATTAPIFESAPVSQSTYQGVPYSYNVVARSVPAPTYSAFNLPPGLTISPVTGVVSGTPTQLGTYSGSFSATNTVGSSQNVKTQTFKITVVTAPAFLQATVVGSLNPMNGTGKHQALVLGADGNFYGTSTTGGAGSNGTVFLMAPIGSQATVHAFGDGTVANDGAQPMGLSLGTDGSLYGTTFAGGTLGKGTIFHTTQGTTTTLYSFGNDASNGSPNSSMLLATDGNFYCTVKGGGFSTNAQLQGAYYTLKSSGVVSLLGFFTGNDPFAAPDSPLTQGSASLLFFGTTASGTSSRGSAFTVSNSTGSPFAFKQFDIPIPPVQGDRPHAPITLMSDGNAYGIASGGGNSANLPNLTSDPTVIGIGGIGTIYKLTGGGSVQTDLHTFGDGTVANDGINTADPGAPIIQGDDGFLYGVTPAGGSANQGCFFQIGTTGGMTVLHSFGDGTTSNDGAVPGPAFIKGKETNTFYVMTEKGGASGNGAICKLSVGLAPMLTASGTPMAGGMIFAAPTGLTYTYTFPVKGNPTPTFAATTGTLPPGLILANGVLSGTFTTAGTSTGVITSSNGVSPNLTQNFSFKIGQAAPAPPGVVGKPYSFSFFRNNTSYTMTTSSPPQGLVLSSAGVLSGTPTVAGSYAGTVTGTGTNGTTGQSFSIVIANTFSTWAAAHFTSDQLNDPTYSGATATPQDDGVPNLLKFLYDMDPTVHVSDADRAALPVAGIDTVTTPGTSYLTLTYRSSAYLSGLTVAVQTSTDLQTWTTVTPDISKTLSTNATTGDSTIEVEVNTGGVPKEFIRLNVTAQ